MPPDAIETPIAAELQQVSCLFGKFAALRSVSLSIVAGSSVVLLGENGAGKSTLLRVIAGLKRPTYGRVHVFGRTPSEQRRRIAYMSHAPMLYDELTGMENLEYFARLHSDEVVKERRTSLDARAALLAVNLDLDMSRRVGEYSQGMRQRASLARVLLTQPDLLLLDEPFSNLDVASANAMIERLKLFTNEPSENGTPRTLILTTHQAELARPLAETTLRMSNGSLSGSEQNDAWR